MQNSWFPVVDSIITQISYPFPYPQIRVEATKMSFNQRFKNLKAKKGFPVLVLFLGLTLGVVVAQIFSNQLSYQLRVRDDSERFTVTEISSTMSDMWGTGVASVGVLVQQLGPGSADLYFEIVNLDNKTISPADFSADGQIRHGDGTVVMNVVPLGSAPIQPGGIIQGGNSSSVIVWSDIDFTQVMDPDLIQIFLYVTFLASVAPGDYSITVYAYSP